MTTTQAYLDHDTEDLVEAACSMLIDLWTEAAPAGISRPSANGASLLFGRVKDIVLDSGMSPQVLQLALWYIDVAKEAIKQNLRSCVEARSYLWRLRHFKEIDDKGWSIIWFGDALSEEDISHLSTLRDPAFLVTLRNMSQSPMSSATNLFIAALVCASKTIFKNLPHNKKWSELAFGYPSASCKIDKMEAAFLEMLDDRLVPTAEEWDQWVHNCRVATMSSVLRSLETLQNS